MNGMAFISLCLLTRYPISARSPLHGVFLAVKRGQPWAAGDGKGGDQAVDAGLARVTAA